MYVVKFDTEPEEAIDPIEAPPTPDCIDVSICKTRFGSTGTTVVVVVTDGTVVVTDGESHEVDDD